MKIGDRGIQLKQFVEHQNEMPESLLYGKWNGKAGVWGMSMVRGPPMCRHVNGLCVCVSVCEHITMHSVASGYMYAGTSRVRVVADVPATDAASMMASA